MNYLEKIQQAYENDDYSIFNYKTYYDQEDNVRVDVSFVEGNDVYTIKFAIFNEDFSVDNAEEEEAYGSYYIEEFFVDIDSEERKKALRDFIFRKALIDANKLISNTKSAVAKQLAMAIQSNRLEMFDFRVIDHQEQYKGVEGVYEYTVELHFENELLKLPVATATVSNSLLEEFESAWAGVTFHIPVQFADGELERFYQSIFSKVDKGSIDIYANDVVLCTPTRDSDYYFHFEYKSQRKALNPTPVLIAEQAYREKDADAFLINAFQGEHRDLYAEVILAKGDVYLGIVQFTIDEDNDVLHDEHCQYFEHADVNLSDSELSSEIYDYLYVLSRRAVDDLVEHRLETAKINAEHALKNLEVDEISYDYGYLPSLKKTYIHVYYVDDLHRIEVAELAYEEHTHCFEPQDKSLVDIQYGVPCQLTPEQEKKLSEIALEMYEAMMSTEEVDLGA